MTVRLRSRTTMAASGTRTSVGVLRTPVPHVAEVMIAHGCTLSVPEIDKQLKDYVFKAEVERLPWIPGVLDVLHSLKEAGVPSMLVTTSPRRMAENIMKQSEGLFAGYVCGDDPYEHKPNPAPYLAAADKLGIAVKTWPSAWCSRISRLDFRPVRHRARL